MSSRFSIWRRHMIAVVAGIGLAMVSRSAFSADAISNDSLVFSDSLSPERESEIAAYFKARAKLDFDPVVFGDGYLHPDYWKHAKRDEADRVMRHQIAVFGKYVQFPNEINWNGMVDADSETVYVLNRFQYLLALREMHQKTGDSKYLKKGIGLMLDWVRRCPAGASRQWAAWRPAETGYRLNAWCQFIDYVARGDSILPRELCALLRSIQEQAQFLADNTKPDSGSDGVIASAGLGIASLVFPELKGSADWSNATWRRFLGDLQTQIYPDGSHQEMSPYYETLVLVSAARVCNLATQRNLPIPPTVLERVHSMNRYLAYLRKLDGSLPTCNASDTQNIDLLLGWIARWLKQDDVLWLATQGKAGTQPGQTDFFAGYSGLAIFRADWNRESQYLLLDAGPFGTAHQHSDTNSVQYAAFGQDFLIDPCRYTYADDAIRTWLIGTSSHNTITVDGGPQRTVLVPGAYRTNKAIDVRWNSGKTFGYATSLYRFGYEVSGNEAIMHRRSVLFVPGQYAVIYDLIQGQDAHRVHLHWSFPPIKVSQVDNQAVIASGPKASMLLRTVGPIGIRTSVSSGLKNPPIGWHSNVYNQVEPAPHVATTVRVRLPARFATLLLPFRNDSKPPTASIQIETMRDEMVRVTIDGKSQVLSPQGPSSQPE